ncbi:hypothetical protein ABIA33_002459 [Streptacidiphilus sp. MAP12-16]|uniref:DUF742 domain-containing protein n=1 Tax=Streptacidiphilus sp. MAP12-16 TaxID=3156300 RepID=UPI0035170996
MTDWPGDRRLSDHQPGNRWPDKHPLNYDAGLVRPYTITGGRTSHPAQDKAFSLITQVLTRDPDVDTSLMEPEPAEILDLCRDRPMGVADIAARLDLPASVVKVLLGDLLDNSMILTRAPVAMAGTPDVRLLQKVIDGIKRL